MLWDAGVAQTKCTHHAVQRHRLLWTGFNVADGKPVREPLRPILSTSPPTNKGVGSGKDYRTRTICQFKDCIISSFFFILPVNNFHRNTYRWLKTMGKMGADSIPIERTEVNKSWLKEGQGEAAPVVAPTCEEMVEEKELIGWAGEGKATPGMDWSLQKRMNEPDRVGWHTSTPYGGVHLALVGCFIY